MNDLEGKPTSKKVWLITGAGRGLGLAIDGRLIRYYRLFVTAVALVPLGILNSPFGRVLQAMGPPGECHTAQASPASVRLMLCVVRRT